MAIVVVVSVVGPAVPVIMVIKKINGIYMLSVPIPMSTGNGAKQGVAFFTVNLELRGLRACDGYCTRYILISHKIPTL